MRGILIRSLAIGGAVVLAACGRLPAPVHTAAPSAVVSDRLYFGRNIRTGGTVADSAWTVFLADVVTPRLPDGFTVYRTEGQWRGADGRVARELGFVLEVHHAAGTPPDSVFERVAQEYARRFKQEAVMRARGPVELWFYRSIPR